MTIMQIQIPDDLKEAIDKAFPSGTFEPALEEWIRSEVERRAAEARRQHNVLEGFRRLRETSPAISTEDVRAIRDELRS
jgi:hypothetical protein